MGKREELEDLKRALLESFDIEESFLILGMRMKNVFRFQVAIFFEVDWKNLVLVPTCLFPSAKKGLLRRKDREVQVSSLLYELFSKPYLAITGNGGTEEVIPGIFPKPLYLFPLKVKQRVMSVIGLGGAGEQPRGKLDAMALLLQEIAPYLEKNLLIDRTIRKNQRLETIIGCGASSYVVVDRAGYVIDYIPDSENRLGFNQEKVSRKHLSTLLPEGQGEVREMWRAFPRKENFTLLLTDGKERRIMTDLTVRKVLLKYSLQKEYYLLKVVSIEDELRERYADRLSSDENVLHLTVTFCPENLLCIKRMGRGVSYLGEGRFLVSTREFLRARCDGSNSCFARISPIRHHPQPELVG
ncbi:MAG: hypothetical protein D6713_07325 [Deltaproteobacteria bacterium]|nr:MAG: hypothetical protein D6713_07325 [Deltaproteobacteria bacterium]